MWKNVEITEEIISEYKREELATWLVLSDPEADAAPLIKPELNKEAVVSIQAAIFAVFGDPTPVTAVLLKKYGYYVAEDGWIGSPQTGIEDSKAIDFEYNEDKSLGDCILSSNQSRVNSDEICIDVKTIGQLRAWHFAIGQPLKEVQS